MSLEGNIGLLLEKLKAYRKKLFNFNRRNKEIFYKPSKGTIHMSKAPFEKGVQIPDDLKETFSPLSCHSDNISTLLETGKLNLNKFFLLNKHDSENLQKKIDKLRLADTKYQREYGISGGWLLGPFLLWSKFGSKSLRDVMMTPIFKIPIDIKKERGSRNFDLILESTDLSINPSLVAAFKETYDLELPEAVSEGTVLEVIETIKDCLRKHEIETVWSDSKIIPEMPALTKILKDEDGNVTGRENIDAEKVLSERDLNLLKGTTPKCFQIVDAWFIDQLNASKMALLNDYNGIMDGAGDHPILNELLLKQPTGGRENHSTLFKELDRYKEKDNYFVVDIDSTQHRAVDKASKERAVVIQGPPGTGKSQTICNIIADLLASGKRILFVSEKRAALDVVANRLEQVKLGDQFTLIHSSDLDRSTLYKKFVDLAHRELDETITEDWHKVANELDETKGEINAYYDLIQEIHEKSGLPIAEIFALISDVNVSEDTYIYADYFSNVAYNQIEAFKRSLEEIELVTEANKDIKGSPWFWKNSNIVNTGRFQVEISEKFKEIEDSFNKASLLKTKLTTTLGVDEEFLESEDLINVLTQFKAELTLEELWAGGIENHHYISKVTKESFREEVLVIKDELEKSATEYAKLKKDIDPDIFEILYNYYKIPRGFSDWFRPEFWKMKSLSKTVLKDPSFKITLTTFGDYKCFKEAKTKFEEIHKKLGVQQPGDITTLDKYLEYISQLPDAFEKNKAEISLIVSLNDLVKNNKIVTFSDYTNFCNAVVSVKNEIFELKDTIKLFNEKFDYFQKLTSNDGGFGGSLKSKFTHSSNLYDTKDDLDIVDKLQGKINSVEKEYKLVDFQSTFFEKINLKDENWVNNVLQGIYSSWHDEIIENYPALRSFDARLFESKINKFNGLVDDHKLKAQHEISNNMITNMESSASDGPAMKLLEKEAKKSRRVLSPREIMEKGAGDLMMKLKPCWLMSPLSISQILPNQFGLFDTVIFDEASQVRVEDAIPSIYRAKTMVVVGDDKQMPPTNFFSGSSNDDELEESDIEESILDLACLVYPSEMLEWHYRSRKEALIAFSNRAFYGGRLIAVPNPEGFADNSALSFERVENGYFNSKSGNEQEAKCVVDELAKRIIEDPTRSIGIISFGTSQQKAIQEEIDNRVVRDRAFANAYNQSSNLTVENAFVGLFNKNLENVQGDERDEILLSVGYAPAGPDKKLRKGFGPLSVSGGGRRLNVAITRARASIKVFCSFDPSELSVDEEAFGKNPETTSFARYLNYVKAVSAGEYDTAKSLLDYYPVSGSATNRKFSRFSLDVKNCIENLGYSVATEVGSSGFFIDIGVEHPQVPGSYLLGIECNGSMFHSSDYARDRDKIRNSLLESRGWKILTVWSQEWSRNRESEINRIKKAIEAILDLNIKKAG